MHTLVNSNNKDIYTQDDINVQDIQENNYDDIQHIH